MDEKALRKQLGVANYKELLRLVKEHKHKGPDAVAKLLADRVAQLPPKVLARILRPLLGTVVDNNS